MLSWNSTTASTRNNIRIHRLPRVLEHRFFAHFAFGPTDRQATFTQTHMTYTLRLIFRFPFTKSLRYTYNSFRSISSVSIYFSFFSFLRLNMLHLIIKRRVPEVGRVSEWEISIERSSFSLRFSFHDVDGVHVFFLMCACVCVYRIWYSRTCEAIQFKILNSTLLDAMLSAIFRQFSEGKVLSFFAIHLHMWVCVVSLVRFHSDFQ